MTGNMTTEDLIKESIGKFAIIGNRIRYITNITEKTWGSTYKYRYLRIEMIDPKTLKSSTKHTPNTQKDITELPIYVLSADQIDAESYKQVYASHSKLSKIKQARLDKLPHPIIFNNKQGLKL